MTRLYYVRINKICLPPHAERGPGSLCLWGSGWCGAGEPGRRGHSTAALGEEDARGQLGGGVHVLHFYHN